MNKIKQHAEPKELQKQRNTLIFDCMTYANEANNKQRGADIALDCIIGLKKAYSEFYHSLSRQADAAGEADMASDFREVAHLFSPWDLNAVGEDRSTFDKLVAEVELLSLGISSGDAIFYVHGDGIKSVTTIEGEEV